MVDPEYFAAQEVSNAWNGRKSSLVTGAGGMRGVGRATALKLASQGADLVITDVRREAVDLPPAEVRLEWNSIESVAEEILALGRQCLPVYTDLGYSEQIPANGQRGRGTLRPLRHPGQQRSGYHRPRDKVPVTELEEDVWHHFLDINTTAVFLCTKFVGREMISQGSGGRIINIASNASKQASAMGAAYSSSKFAVLGLTQASALDLAPYGITVNAVCPGPINTDRMSYWERSQAQERGVSQEDFRAQIVQQAGESTPLGRIAEAEDIANMVSFLSSEEANFITGQAYNVNGGLLFH